MVTRAKQGRFSAEGCGLWTKEEHQRFLDALQVYPAGPWKLVAEIVGTRSVRQTMTHAQKHRQKQARHARGLHVGQKRTLDAPSREAPSGAIAAKKKRKQSSTTETLSLEATATPALAAPLDDDGAADLMIPPASSFPTGLPFQSESSVSHALDELLYLVGSAHIAWPEAQLFPTLDTTAWADPMPFKPDLWALADDSAMGEFLTSSII